MVEQEIVFVPGNLDGESQTGGFPGLQGHAGGAGALGALIPGDPAGAARILAGSPILLLWVLGIALVSTAIPYYLYTWGLQHMDPGRAAILASVEPLVGAVLGMTAYGEPHGVPKLLGIALILAAILVLNGKEKESGKRSPIR